VSSKRDFAVYWGLSALWTAAAWSLTDISLLVRCDPMRYEWPMSAHASQAFSTSTLSIPKIYLTMKLGALPYHSVTCDKHLQRSH